MENLYEQLGGKTAIDQAVDIFYTKVLSDDRVNEFFKDTDMNKQKRMQKAFLTFAFGGPNNYQGRNMRKAHEKVVADGLNDAHFDTIVELLAETLKELNANDEQIAKVATIANSIRDDVLNR